jgi:DNA polymerase-3 subunit beta
MKIECKRVDLNDALQEIVSVVPSSTMIPILNNVMLTVEGAKMTITGSDMEISLAIEIPCTAESDFSTTVPAKLFSDIVKTISEETITLDFDGQNIHLYASKAKFLINCLEPSEYPKLPQVNGNAYDLQSGELNRLYRKVTPAIAPKGESNISFSSVLMETISNELRLVTTDGQRLIVSKYWEKTDLSSMKILLPPKSLQVLSKISGKKNSIVTMTVADRELSFAFDRHLLITRRIDGVFPEYERVIPTSFTYKFFLVKSTLMNALNRVYLVVRDSSKKVTFRIADNELSISSTEQEIGSGEDSMAVESSGGEYELILDAKKLMDGIEAVETEKVMFETNGPFHPLVIKDQDSENYIYVLVSLRPK